MGMTPAVAAAPVQSKTLTLYRRHLQTPIGPMLALASSDGLCALEFSGPRRLNRLEGRLSRWFPPHEIVDAPNAVLDLTHDWLSEYFGGVSAAIEGIPLDLRGAAFEQRVWRALREIPPGETTSYGEIARRLGSPGAPRAVGLANGANPVAIIVPCHRVIGANGSLVGYGGGLNRKTWLLDHERRWRQDALF